MFKEQHTVGRNLTDVSGNQWIHLRLPKSTQQTFTSLKHKIKFVRRFKTQFWFQFQLGLWSFCFGTFDDFRSFILELLAKKENSKKEEEKKKETNKSYCAKLSNILCSTDSLCMQFLAILN